mgnify:CR=1 FL=1
MSLNHIVYDSVTEDQLLDVEFKAVHLDEVIFKDNLPFSGRIQTNPDLNNYNTLYFRNESNISTPLNNSLQRYYEQMIEPPLIIDNGDGESSIFNTTDGLGTNYIPEDSARRGSKYHVLAHGNITTSGGLRDITIKSYLGDAIVSEATITLPNLNQGGNWELRGDLVVYATGIPGIAKINTFYRFDFTNNQGLVESSFIDSINNTTYQTTIPGFANITFEWLSLNEGNSLSVRSLSLSAIL